MLAGCAQSLPPKPHAGSEWDVRPAGVADPADLSGAGGQAPSCGDPRASLPPDDSMSGATVSRIVQRGYLIAGVNQNAFHVGYRDPATGSLVGFEIDIVREIARALLGDPNKVRFAAIDAAEREAALESGEVDMVARTMTMTCAAREKVAFSTEYFTARQRLLVPSGSTVRQLEELDGARVCAAAGSTSLTNLGKINPKVIPVSTADVVDCLVLLQQHQVDAVSTSDILLVALAAQDPHTKVVGRELAVQPFGVAMAKSATDLVRLVNSVLDRLREDGTWTSSYTRWLSPVLGAPPAPPAPIYQ